MITGGEQYWLHKGISWNACGPTAGSNMLVNLLNIPDTKQNNLSVMKIVYPLMRPHKGGVYPFEFKDGIEQYLLNHTSLNKDDMPTVNAVWIPSNERKNNPRRENLDFLDECVSYIKEGTKNNNLVAFLNLNNGRVKGLHSWHWVNIYDIDDDYKISILDNTKLKSADFKKWYLNGTKRGGLVWFSK